MAKRIRERGEELLHTEVMDTGNTISKTVRRGRLVTDILPP